MGTVMQYLTWPFVQTCSLVDQLNPGSQPDACIRIRLTDEETSKPREEILFAHKHVLAKSVVLRQQLAYFGSDVPPFTFSTCFLDLTMVPHAMTNFKKLLMVMYGGGSGDEMPPESTVTSLAKLIQFPEMPTTQAAATSKSIINDNLMASQLAMLTSMSSMPTLSDTGNPITNLYASSLLQNSAAPAFIAATIAAMNSLITPIPPTSTEASLPFGGSTLSSSTSPSVPDRLSSTVPSVEVAEQLIVSNDKEGWCRNKKYIETVPNGYRCTVCRKVYGRYNSVSYHVTIYHRNPPIQCGVEGCPFTTREARYIHFHKYYRHGIKLPDSIDLASRKCPYCRHISKSPAMLEKHICRHVQDCLKNGHDYTCFKCTFKTTDQKAILTHLREHSLSVDGSDRGLEATSLETIQTMLHCQLCNHVAEDQNNLQRHQILKHSSDLTTLTLKATTTPVVQPTITLPDGTMTQQQLTLMAWQQLFLNQTAANAAMTASSTMTSTASPSPTGSDAISTASSTL